MQAYFIAIFACNICLSHNSAITNEIYKVKQAKQGKTLSLFALLTKGKYLVSLVYKCRVFCTHSAYSFSH